MGLAPAVQTVAPVGGVVPDHESSTSLLQAWDPVERTLLVPLVARALGHRWHLDALLPDTSAERVLEQLGWQDSIWSPDPVTLALILWRTQTLCAWALTHFEQHPKALGLNVGAGLSDYFQWLDNGSNRWLDTDLACVVQVRSRCLPDRAHAQSLALDVCEDHWWSQVERHLRARHEPMWIMLEGVLIYLSPQQVQRLLATVGEHAPAGSSLAFDVIPRWMVGWPIRVPLAAAQQAEFQWGIDTTDQLESLHGRLHVEQVESSPAPWIGWPWMGSVGWNACSPYALVRMSVT